MQKGPERRIRKSNNLIEARFRITLNEFRILLYCAAQITPMRKDVRGVFEIHAQDYADMFNLSLKNAYKQIRDGLDATWDREFFEWLPQGKGREPGWARRRFVISQEYHPSQGYGVLEVHPDFLNHLADLSEKYTDYALRNMHHLGSFNAMRIYEMLTQYAKIGKRTFNVAWFQEVLFLENNYQRWTDLKKHVLVPSLQAIHKHTDIEIIKDTEHGWFVPKKTGRRVTEFEIKFRRRAQQTLDLGEVPEPVSQAVWEKQGYRSPKEYEEARYLMERHNVAFRNARDFIAFKNELLRKGERP